MANGLINSEPRIVGADDPAQRRAFVSFVYRISRAPIGDELADQLRFPKQWTVGVLLLMRWRLRLRKLHDRLAPGRVHTRHVRNFTTLPERSILDDAGISDRLPDHVSAGLGLRFRHALWWLAVPLTLAPQYFMRSIFGADNPTEVPPVPSVFAYYSTFFPFGVFFHQHNIQVRRWWTVAVLPALLIFPPGVALAYPEAFGLDAAAAWVNGVSAVLQVTYSWLMCFGLMGLFRCIASRERSRMRYMSDASYWIYLGRVPLIIAGQLLIADWPISAHLKYLMVCLGVSAFLLTAYQYGVRYTVVGTMLNGPRRRVRPDAGRAAPC